MRPEAGQNEGEPEQSLSAAAEARKLANLTPGGAPHQKKRRRYKVDRLPVRLQEGVMRGYARGDSFRDIAAALKKAGQPVGKDAIRKYYHAVWRDEHERLRRARLAMVALKESLQLEPESESGAVAEELLYTAVCDRWTEFEEEPWEVLLREAREQQKATGQKKRTRVGKMSAVEQAREVRRRWRELYGLEETDDDTEEKGDADERA